MKIYYIDANKLTDTQLGKIFMNSEEHRKAKYLSSKSTVSARECIAADALIKFGVSDYLPDFERNPHTAYLKSGKPVFTDVPLNLSISHTEGHVFIAIHEKNVGIDAEMLREIDYNKINLRFFGNDGSSPESAIDFFRKWTSLEARFKFDNKEKLEFDITKYKAPVFSSLYRNCVVSIAYENSDTLTERNIDSYFYNVIPEDL